MRSGRIAVAVLAALAVVAGGASLVRGDIPPPPSTYVLDEADWLDASEEARLSQTLLDYERQTSNQIVVAIFRSYGDDDLADFSVRVAEKWGVGQRGHDNGILLALYDAERQIDIEVGYGLESVVTDAIANEIRIGILVPALREGRKTEGIFEATSALMDAARGEFKGTGRAVGDRPVTSKWPILLFLLFFILVSVLSSRLGPAGPLILGGPGFGRGGRLYRRGGFFPGGGFFGGGGSGGGFRGGGGSFGGGGARGGW
jgi:uncharacterized protein